jgi:hypothetical protein
MEGEPQQPLLAGRRHVRGQVQKGSRVDHSRRWIEHADQSALLDYEQPLVVAWRGGKIQRLVKPHCQAADLELTEHHVREQETRADGPAQCSPR